MDLESEILKEHSKRQMVRIAKWVGNDRKRFKQLMDLFLHGEFRVTQRAAWIISECYELNPQLVIPWLPAMIKKMQEPGVHDAVRRNVVRLLQFVEIPLPCSELWSRCALIISDPSRRPSLSKHVP